jgi:histidine kinase 2/3/4 (cytokinin receptor)
MQKLVKLRKGEISVNSKPGDGSVFKFSLTFPTSGQCGNLSQISLSMKRQLSDIEEEKLRGIRILLVDPHPVRQEVVATYLRRLDVILESAEDVQSAQDVLTRKEGPSFQAVIVDLQGLGHSCALNLVQSLRKEPGTKVLPFLALSRPVVSDMQKELQEAGFSYMVHKPLRYSTLAAGLLKALGVQLQNTSRRMDTNSKMLVGKRLLVVDDNMVNRRVASSMLLRYGATVVSVNGGVEAVTAVRKQEPGEEIDLVLMDIQMPEV